MNAETLKMNLLALVDTFETQEESLTQLDRAIGDGDHGVNMLRGFRALPDNLDDSSVSTILKSTGMTLMSHIGGASGPLYGFSFVKMAQVAGDEITPNNLSEVLQAFSDAIAQRGKVELNEKTMFDVIERARLAVDNGESITFEKLQTFADDTKEMIATKGRAAYFKEDSKGHVDPGAQSSVYVLNALIGDE
ncbi:dihydroxyacetone kinase subunit L [Staphylococcus arlettae]|jgi:phosphoenolpyruvate---glycerone phosphotransferase subunit DhaL|uniref:phosphoenolpyruvate--glycerone phosphotransferase n=1 Tax=Staphylococcus arlettae TaxID=29378 RepID=A0A380CQA6_9STAP|nr:MULTISPECIES: dihydroxyacetone kinase subunit DhaL [Staphylococcus]HAP2020189.1 dihydroxyacetone kinase subunit L [Escherichia coli]KAB2480871.1 dihydroxyacetone kinase subunit L [Staphylococcus sp. CH99b_3]MCD8839688.1 dihydroxyacetone kinase subunit L [Staphylococcus arlettae]MCD8841545.1 dihydroxyacetone kinase subunit L [Staphylococcus arlettae]MCD8867197.1 dihydroxyacetone kinase subunit L [Staphylococcus arlettae]